MTAAPSITPAMADRGARATFASGAAFGVLQLASAVLFGALILPRLGDPAAPVAHWAPAYRAHGSLLRAGNFLLLLPTPLFLLFLGGLHRAVSSTGARTLAASGAVAGAAAAMLWPLSAVLNDIDIDIAIGGGDAGTVAALNGIGPYLLALGALGRAVLLGVAAATLPASALVPRWTGWLGTAAAVLSVAGAFTLLDARAFPVLALATLAFDLWTVATGVTLYRRSSRG